MYLVGNQRRAEQLYTMIKSDLCSRSGRSNGAKSQQEVEANYSYVLVVEVMSEPVVMYHICILNS